MEEIIQLITNYGIGVVCVGYLIYFQNTTMKTMTEILKNVEIRLGKIETILDVQNDNN